MAHTPAENPDAAQLALLGDEEQGPLFGGPVAHVENIVDGARGRGRPKGSRNKRSADMVAYLQAKGYRDPMETLAAIASADPRTLAIELSAIKVGKGDGVKVEVVTTAEAMGIIVKAAAELMPYFHSKAPVEVQVEERRLGVLVIGEVAANGPADSEFLSLTGEVIEAD